MKMAWLKSIELSSTDSRFIFQEREWNTQYDKLNLLTRRLRVQNALRLAKLRPIRALHFKFYNFTA